MWLALLIACGPPSDGEVRSAKAYLDVPGASVLDVRYGSDGMWMQGMLAVPDGDGPFPLVFYNHGGFGGMRDGEITTLATEAAARGVVVAAAMYRGEGESEGEIEYCSGEVDDVLRFGLAARELAYLTNERLAMGSSHGACISLMVNSRDALLGTVTMGTPTEVQVLMDWHYTEGDPDHAAKWEPYVDNDAAGMSPLYADLHPPLVLLHGVDDEVVPLPQACLLHDTLAPTWPTGSYRLGADDQPLPAGSTTDCQGSVQAGDPWADRAVDDGLLLVSWEGVAHHPPPKAWTMAWGRVSAWLD